MQVYFNILWPQSRCKRDTARPLLSTQMKLVVSLEYTQSFAFMMHLARVTTKKKHNLLSSLFIFRSPRVVMATDLKRFKTVFAWALLLPPPRDSLFAEPKKWEFDYGKLQYIVLGDCTFIIHLLDKHTSTQSIHDLRRLSPLQQESLMRLSPPNSLQYVLAKRHLHH